MTTNMKIEVLMGHPKGPHVLCPVDNPTQVEEALPEGWCVGDHWWCSSPDAKQEDGRWLLPLMRVEDMERQRTVVSVDFAVGSDYTVETTLDNTGNVVSSRFLTSGQDD